MPGIKNSHYTSYFPFLTILLFSAAFAVSVESKITELLQSIGVYQALIEFFSAGSIRLLLFGGFVLSSFFIISGLKVVAQMLMQFTCLFFADENQEAQDKRMEEGRFLFLGGSAVSLLFAQYFIVIGILFIVTTGVYFIFVTYRMADYFTTISLVGFIFTQLLVWLIIGFGTGFLILRTYRYILESLPV